MIFLIKLERPVHAYPGQKRVKCITNFMATGQIYLFNSSSISDFLSTVHNIHTLSINLFQLNKSYTS